MASAKIGLAVQNSPIVKCAFDCYVKEYVIRLKVKERAISPKCAPEERFNNSQEFPRTSCTDIAGRGTGGENIDDVFFFFLERDECRARPHCIISQRKGGEKRKSSSVGGGERKGDMARSLLNPNASFLLASTHPGNEAFSLSLSKGKEE